MDSPSPVTRHPRSFPRACARRAVSLARRVAATAAFGVFLAAVAIWLRAGAFNASDHAALGFADATAVPPAFIWVDVTGYANQLAFAVTYRTWAGPKGGMPSWWGPNAV